MPILCENNVLELRRDPIDDSDHGVPIGHSQRAAGTKIVLYVDDDQDVLRGNLHWVSEAFPKKTSIAARM
jgi:hypothetical protein